MKIYDSAGIDLQTNPVKNASIDASQNTISKLSLAMFASGVIKTDLSASITDDASLASAKAAKSYAATAAAAAITSVQTTDIAAALAASQGSNTPTNQAVANYVSSIVTNSNHFRGNVNLSAGVSALPSTGGSGTSGAIKAGDYWVITVVGTTITGLSPDGKPQVGDVLFASVDSPSSVSNWFTVQGNMSPATAAQAEAKSDSTLYLTSACLTNFVKEYSTTVTTDGTTSTYTVTHGLGAFNTLIPYVIDGTTKEHIIPGIADHTATAGLAVDITFTPPYPAGSFIINLMTR